MERAMPTSSFFELFSLALIEALTEREQSFVELRYGVASGEPHTLEQVAQTFSLSRERIRQVLARCLRKIKSRGKRELRRGETTGACASLLLYIEQACQPDKPGYIERIMTFAQDCLPYLPQRTYAFPLLTSLLFNKEKAEPVMTELLTAYAEKTAEQALQVKVEKLDLVFNRLLSGTLWPPRVQRDAHHIQNLVDRHLERTVSSNGLGITGSFFSQKLSRDVHARSLLEIQMLQCLEAAEVVEYYQEQPFLVTEQAYGEERTYCPDILVLLKDGRGVLVEVNSWTHMALQKNLIKYETLRIFCIKNGLGLLITDGRRTFKEIRQHAIPPVFQKALLDAIAQSQTQSLSWSEYQALRDQHSASWMDFLAVVLANRLAWSLLPFTLRRRAF
jgi:hypothetical protein